MLKVVEDIKANSTPIKGSAEVAQVGTISANGERKRSADMIARAMEKVGNEGVITVEEAKSLETELDVGRGHAVRPWLSLPLLHHQCRQDDRRAG